MTFSSPAESGQKDIHQLSPSHQVNMSRVTFHLPETTTPGIYRIIPGKTRVAEILHQVLMGFAIFA